MGRNASTIVKAEGIMLSGEDFIIKRAASIKASDAREVISHVAPVTFAGLIDHARRLRMTPGALAAEFITDGVASGKKSVRAVKGAPDDALVEQLEAAHEKIAALKNKMTYEEDARALRFAQKEAAEKRVSALEQELRQEKALHMDAIEWLKQAEEARDEARKMAEGVRQDFEAAQLDIETMQIRNDQLLTEIAACARPLPPIITIQAEQPVQPETREALAAMANAAAAHLRSIRALKAAGNSAAEIAETLGLPLDQVKSILKGAK